MGGAVRWPLHWPGEGTTSAPAWQPHAYSAGYHRYNGFTSRSPSHANAAMNTDLDATRAIDPRYARAVTATFTALFVDADSARRTFVEAVGCHGAFHAEGVLRSHAEQFGELATYAHRPRHDAAEAGFYYALELERHWRSLILNELPMLLDANNRLASEHALRIVSDHHAVTERELAGVRERRAQAATAVREFAAVASGVYACYRSAVWSIRAHLRHYGPDATYRALVRFPQQFGELRRSDVEVGFTWSAKPILCYRTAKPAQRLAKRLPALLQTAASALLARPKAGELIASTLRVARADQARREAEAAARRFPWSIEEYLQDTRVEVLSFVSTRNPPACWRRLAGEMAPMLPAETFAGEHP